MRKKLKDTGGFTLVEMLCAAIILVLLSLMMSTGLSLAAKSYRDITAESEIRLLRNSLTDVLTDRLHYAVVTGPETGGVITPQQCTFGTTIGADGTLTGVSINSNGMFVADTQKMEGGTLVVVPQRILSDGAYGEKINGSGDDRRYRVESVGTEPFIKYNGVAANSFTINFAVKDTRSNISQTTTLTIPCLNPVKKS